MEFLKTILRIMDAEMSRPEPFGWFHLLFFALSIGLAVLLCLLYSKGIIKNPQKVVLITAIVVIILEIYKQINYSFDPETLEFNYQWYAFPWQFCSTPMYVGLLAGIFKKGKFHDCLCAFLATYGVFAGICVMLLPSDVFIETIGINIQTMVCHGSMITVGVFLFYTNHVKPHPKTILKALPVFATCVGVATVLNEIAYYTGLLEEHDFNMFFVSRHCEPHLIVYSDVQRAVPYPWCLIIYILGFTLAATIVLVLSMAISAVVRLIKNKVKKEKPIALMQASRA